MKGLGIIPVLVFTLLLIVGFIMFASVVKLLRWLGKGGDFSVEMASITIKEALLNSFLEASKIEDLSLSDRQKAYLDFEDIATIEAGASFWQKLFIREDENVIRARLGLFPRIYEYNGTWEEIALKTCFGRDDLIGSYSWDQWMFTLAKKDSCEIPAIGWCGECGKVCPSLDFVCLEMRGAGRPKPDIAIANAGFLYLLKFEEMVP